MDAVIEGNPEQARLASNAHLAFIEEALLLISQSRVYMVELSFENFITWLLDWLGQKQLTDYPALLVYDDYLNNRGSVQSVRGT